MRGRFIITAVACCVLLVGAVACGSNDDTNVEGPSTGIGPTTTSAHSGSAAPMTSAPANASQPMGGEHVEYEATDGMSISTNLTPDPKAGYNLEIKTTGFEWKPEHASGSHIDGEGHAHLYIDGVKIGRLYGPWAHVPLEPGEHKVTVTLNANDHGDYVRDGRHLESVMKITVPASK